MLAGAGVERVIDQHAAGEDPVGLQLLAVFAVLDPRAGRHRDLLAVLLVDEGDFDRRAGRGAELRHPADRRALFRLGQDQGLVQLAGVDVGAEDRLVLLAVLARQQLLQRPLAQADLCVYDHAPGGGEDFEEDVVAHLDALALGLLGLRRGGLAGRLRRRRVVAAGAQHQGDGQAGQGTRGHAQASRSRGRCSLLPSLASRPGPGEGETNPANRRTRRGRRSASSDRSSPCC